MNFVPAAFLLTNSRRTIRLEAEFWSKIVDAMRPRSPFDYRPWKEKIQGNRMTLVLRIWLTANEAAEFAQWLQELVDSIPSEGPKYAADTFKPGWDDVSRMIDLVNFLKEGPCRVEWYFAVTPPVLPLPLEPSSETPLEEMCEIENANRQLNHALSYLVWIVGSRANR